MGGFLKISASFLLIIALGILGMLLLILETNPLVPDNGSVSSGEFQQTLAFIEKSDPRGLQSGAMASLTLRAADMQVLLNYMLEVARNGAAEVDVRDGFVTTVASIKMPAYLLQRYLNLQISLSGNLDALAIEKLKLGKMEVPAWLANTVIKWLYYALEKKAPQYAEIANVIDSYKIIGDEVIITYRWRPELIERLSDGGRDLLIEDEDKERLRIYFVKLAEIVGDPALPATLSLVELLHPMFEFAKSRTENPVDENSAAIVAMALYVMDVDIAKLMGGEMSSAVLRRHRFTLTGRQDFAKHFITSAAITVSASTTLADSFGLLKEIEDTSAGGSGFSFTDVGADRAGVKFAELAISNSQNAIALQAQLSGNISESLIIPDLKGLPEFMSQDEFLKRYGGVDQPQFQDVMNDIEERISQLPIFNSL